MSGHSDQPPVTGSAALSLPCGCKWTPGIDLPTTECNEHRDDPQLAHGTTTECVIKGPYHPVGDVDFECRTHGVVAVLRDLARYGAADIRRAEMRCPVGEPDA